MMFGSDAGAVSGGFVAIIADLLWGNVSIECFVHVRGQRPIPLYLTSVFADRLCSPYCSEAQDTALSRR